MTKREKEREREREREREKSFSLYFSERREQRKPSLDRLHESRCFRNVDECFDLRGRIFRNAPFEGSSRALKALRTRHATISMARAGNAAQSESRLRRLHVATYYIRITPLHQRGRDTTCSRDAVHRGATRNADLYIIIVRTSMNFYPT